MYDRGTMPHRAGAALLLLVALGCGRVTTDDAEEASATDEPGAAFDPATAGVLCGRVSWDGPDPSPAPFRVLHLSKKECPFEVGNPLAPVLHPGNRGVAGAVIALRGIDPAQARPWHHPPVRVEQGDRDLHVYQGDQEVGTGFVRRGDEIEMAARGDRYHTLRGRGAAFFSYTFPDAGVVRRRRLDAAGVVELSSGAGYYWLRGHLHVSDHPYLARTDADGCFEIAQVPPGRYRAACWLPNWNVLRKERGPESAAVENIAYAGPLEQTAEVVLGPGGQARVEFLLCERDFAP